MAKLIQYAVITATEEQLREQGLRTLHPKQRVVVENVLFNLKLCIVKVNQFTNSFHVMKRSDLNLIENQQLALEFE